MNIAAARAAFDTQLRRDPPLDLDGDRIDHTAHTVRYHTAQGWCSVLYADFDGTEGPDDTDVAGIDEWKYYDHDRPADLPARLIAAGLTPEDPEAFMAAAVDELDPVRPPGVEVVDGDVDRMVAVQRRVFGDPAVGGTATGLDRLRAGVAAGQLIVLVAVLDGVDVAAARLEFHRDREFAGMWGGGTLARYRGRGVYRALVAHRAELAAQRGIRYLYADCLPDSEPILARAGFHRLATTVPFRP